MCLSACLHDTSMTFITIQVLPGSLLWFCICLCNTSTKYMYHTRTIKSLWCKFIVVTVQGWDIFSGNTNTSTLYLEMMNDHSLWNLHCYKVSYVNISYHFMQSFTQIIFIFNFCAADIVLRNTSVVHFWIHGCRQ